MTGMPSKPEMFHNFANLWNRLGQHQEFGKCYAARLKVEIFEIN